MSIEQTIYEVNEMFRYITCKNDKKLFFGGVDRNYNWFTLSSGEASRTPMVKYIDFIIADSHNAKDYAFTRIFDTTICSSVENDGYDFFLYIPLVLEDLLCRQQVKHFHFEKAMTDLARLKNALIGFSKDWKEQIQNLSAAQHDVACFTFQALEGQLQTKSLFNEFITEMSIALGVERIVLVLANLDISFISSSEQEKCMNLLSGSERLLVLSISDS